MGAKQSREPRSVSMENPTPAGVLDISDDVVKRLKQGIRQQGKVLASNHSMDKFHQMCKLLRQVLCNNCQMTIYYILKNAHKHCS